MRRYWRGSLLCALAGVLLQLGLLGIDVLWWQTLPPDSGLPMRWSGKFDRFDPIGVAVMRELQWNYYYSRIVERVPAMELVFYFVVFAVECFLFGLVAQLLWTRWKRLTGRQAQT